MNIVYKPVKTLDHVRADVASGKAKKVYYGAVTCWWTINPRDLYHGPVPTDPRGGVLFESEDVSGFLAAAAENPSFYGEHGLRTFEAAYHGNVRTEIGLPTCFRTWPEYDRLVDETSDGT